MSYVHGRTSSYARTYVRTYVSRRTYVVRTSYVRRRTHVRRYVERTLSVVRLRKSYLRTTSSYYVVRRNYVVIRTSTTPYVRTYALTFVVRSYVRRTRMYGVRRPS